MDLLVGITLCKSLCHFIISHFPSCPCLFLPGICFLVGPDKGFFFFCFFSCLFSFSLSNDLYTVIYIVEIIAHDSYYASGYSST